MPRLKGLDEMPRSRRTLRQVYFSIRSGVVESPLPAWMWVVLLLALLSSIVWGTARLFGLP